MKKIFITLVLVLNVHVAFTQTTFEKTYKRLIQDEAAQSVIEDGNGGFVIATGGKRASTTNTREFGLAHINAFGDTIWYTVFTRSFRPALSMVRKSASAYYVAGVADDSSATVDLMLWLCKFDLNGNVIWKKNIMDFNLPLMDWGLSFDVVKDGLLFTNGYSGGYYKLDTNANIVNINNYYFYLNNSDYFRKSDMQKKDSIYYYNSAYSSSLTSGPYRPKFLLIDENGDSLSSFSINLDSAWGSSYTNIYQSNFIVFAFVPPIIVPNAYGFVISKLDSLGNKIWRRPVRGINRSNCYVTGHCILPNGNFVISGFPGGLSAPAGRAFLYCFDTNGDSLWFKKFSPSDTTLKTDFYDVIATSDSGLLACGQAMRPNGSRESYIVKLDANGDLFNPLSIIEKRKESYFHLYPNPANNVVSMHYMGFDKNVVLNIHNALGEEVFTQKINGNDERLQLNTTNYPPGIYTCSLHSDNGIIAFNKVIVLK
ncbi:MAG: T9SS type A sorting domain-containing protein [Bacteroidetes bacterium]|nr:T9SS type A sorting domain-containing protein [Bacteroidota bacterium]